MQTYSQKQLHNIAHDNYELLCSYCRLLDNEGYWEGPGAVLGQSIETILDMYVQTVLIRFALFCGSLGPDERAFIAELPKVNAYGLDRDTEAPDSVEERSGRMYNSPPILLQLCGLRDRSKGSGLFGLFFDALLNIQLAMAFYDALKTARIARFIHEYFTRIEAFIGTGNDYGSMLDERYIFKKLCSDSLEKSAFRLKESGESFERYRQNYIAEPVVRTSQPADIRHSDDVPARETVQEVQLPESELFDSETELEKLLAELNSLVGLDSVKEEVKSLINLIRVRTLRKQHNMPLMDMSFHMVFTGNPGTGKTTVARLVAGIYKELGLLSKGQLIETDRSGLVAGYVGQTAIKVKEVVDKALGGVLFIDEAYALAPSTANDFGEEAIETLVKLMEDHRDDLVVIAAGYTVEMEKFLKSNSGLTSRFNRFIVFEDYSDDELISILKVMADKAGYKLSSEAEAAVRVRIVDMAPERRASFGNARGIRNMFERIVMNQANRLSGINEPDMETLSLIEAEDIV